MDLKAIHSAPLLDDAEAVELVKRWQATRDRAACERVCRSYYRLATGIARQYPSGRGRHYEDAVQEGMLGLMRAMEKFDPNRGVKFSTYAPLWVRAYVVAYLRDRVTTVRVSQSRATRRVFSNLGRVTAEMHASGERVTSEAVADKLGVKTADVERVWALIGSYNMRSVDTGGMRTLAWSGDSPEEMLLGAESEMVAREVTSKFADTLGHNDRVVFERRMVAETPATLQAIGDQLGLSKERIRQIEKKLKRKLEQAARREERVA